MTWTDKHAEALSAVFEALDRNGVAFLVLRNHQGLPETNQSKDIDLGVSPHEFDKAQHIVSEALRDKGFFWKETTKFQWARCSSYFKLYEGGQISIKIDIMDGYTWRAANLFNFSKLYSSRVLFKDFYIPDPIDNATILWLKPLMTGNFIKPAYVAEISSAVAAGPDRFRANVQRLLGPRVGERAWSDLSSGALEKTLRYRRSISWMAWWREVSTAPGIALQDILKYTSLEIKRRFRRPHASFLSVAGPDGVGKTTFIEGLAAKLAELQVKDRDAILVKHFRPHIFPNIKTLMTGREESLDAFHEPHRAQPASLPSSILRIGYYWADYVLGYWIAIRHRCVAGRTIIFDRYFYDFIVDPRRSRLSLPAWLPRALLAITPKPDLVFFLDCDPDMIFARKQELSRGEIARQLDAYRELATSDPDRFVRLDASQDPDRIVKEALRQLVMRSYDRIDSRT